MRYEIKDDIEKIVGEFMNELNKLGITHKDVYITTDTYDVDTYGNYFPKKFNKFVCKIGFVVPEKYIDVIKED